jgi:ubiquinone/menaquinone biosynthesis C-methylase UbiE
MFNKRASEPRYQSTKIINTLAINQGEVIADIGSGGGHFTFQFAEAVGRDGHVYAIDVNQKLLDYVQQQAETNGYQNITVHCVTNTNLMLPPNTFDLLFIRNVYHHLPDRIQYFKKLHHVLKSSGRIVIIEYTRHGFFRRLLRHYVPHETIISEMRQAGYQVAESFTFLPDQSFTIFHSQLPEANRNE